MNFHKPITQLQVINTSLNLFHLYPHQPLPPIILKQLSDIPPYVFLKEDLKTFILKKFLIFKHLINIKFILLFTVFQRFNFISIFKLVS